MKTLRGLFRFRLAVGVATFALVFGHGLQVEAASWVTNGPMNSPRRDHTATLLPTGKVLVVCGSTAAPGLSGPISTTADLYDPATGKWTTTGSPSIARVHHTATLLLTGKVIVAGGVSSAPASAELYDPVTGTWTPTGTMSFARWDSTATLLPNGKVLVAGGSTANKGILSSAELYDPDTGMWTPTDSLTTPRVSHTATLLRNGLVLVAGGIGIGTLSSVELYNPATGTWTATNSLINARARFTATVLPNGKVLFAGGYDGGGSAALYDPVTGTWQATGNLTAPRESHRATLLPNGKVLVTGGWNSTSSYLASTDLYDPDVGTWTASNPMFTARWLHTSTLLANGKVLVAGGSSANALSNTEVYDPTSNPATGTWTYTGAMNTPRYDHTATLLPNGKVLTAAGRSGGSVITNTATLYDSVSGTWMEASALLLARYDHTATLLPCGKVLFAGGGSYTVGFPNQVAATNSAELYDSDTGAWTNTGAMTTARSEHTATLLVDGKVLVAGGDNPNCWLCGSSAELYDANSGTWQMTGPMTAVRAGHTATVLPNGKILAVGGGNRSSELYDPQTGKWSATGAMAATRTYHSATMLPNGTVLVTGGLDNSGRNSLSSAELYDPLTESWTGTGPLSTARHAHQAALLPNGQVLVIAGEIYTNLALGVVVSAESYDPANGKWTTTAVLNTGRFNHTATLLPNGKVIATGGVNFGAHLSSAELFDAGLSFSNSWRPKITSLTSPLNLGGSLVVAGAQFRGISGASGGNTQDSSSDYPLVQLRSIESGQTTFLLSTNWSTNSFTSVPVWNFPPGRAMATVFVNAIPSTSSIVNITVPTPVATTITGPQRLTNGSFQFAFTNNPGAVFGVLATTNVLLPSSNWTALGGITELSPGRFQFTDTQATNNPQRFYRLRAP